MPTQIDICKEFIAKYDILTLTKIYKEDNVSGMFTDNRPEYLAMLTAAEQREIDVIVVLRLDRFGRDAVNSETARRLLNAYGCTLIAGDDIFDNTPMGEFTRGISLYLNQYQARSTASRVMQSEIHNAKKGDSAGGIAPYGLRIVDKRYELDENEAPIVKRIFEMCARRKQLSGHHRYPQQRRYHHQKRQKVQSFNAKLDA